MNKPIRVLQVIGIMNQGGAENMIMNLYRQIDREKVQFDFVENENEGAYFDLEIRDLGGNIYHCPRFNGKNYLEYRKWWKDFFNTHKEYSVVHGHIGSTAAIYLQEAKNHGIKTIAHSHNIDGKGKKRLFYKLLSYPTRDIADYLFMCSKQAGIDRFGKETIFNQNRAYLVPNAIDINKFSFNETVRKEKRKELGITDLELLFGHVGRFAQQKNHSFLIDVFEQIVKINPSSRLLLVGDGELRSLVEEKAVSLGLKDRIVFAGNRSDVNELLSAMDVMIFPSKYEGLPVTLVEAQCNGLSCVISDNIPSDSVLIPELVRVHSLAEKPAVWAKTALECKLANRSNCADKIKETGFDVEKSAKWLEEFYLEKAKKRDSINGIHPGF